MSFYISFFHLFWIIPLLIITGYFVNFAADVLPLKRSLKTKPLCLNCKQTFELSNYITIKSCDSCGQKQNNRHLIILLITVILPIFSLFFLKSIVEFLLALIVITYLEIIFVIDLEHRLILHPTTIAGIILFSLVGSLHNGILKTILGGVGGFVIMGVLYLFGLLFGKWMSKRRGEEIEEVALGYGDVNLSLVLGLLLGWPGIGLGLFFAIIGGGIFSGLVMLFMAIRRKYQAFTPIPYAPFLILSALMVLYISITN